LSDNQWSGTDLPDTLTGRKAQIHYREVLSSLERLGHFGDCLSAEQILEVGKEFLLLARSFFLVEFRGTVPRTPELIVKDQTVHDDSQTESRHNLYKVIHYAPNQELVDYFDTLYEGFETLGVLFLQQAKVGVQYPSVADLRSQTDASFSRASLAIATGVPHNQMDSVEFDKMHKEWINLRKGLQTKYEKLWTKTEQKLLKKTEKSFRSDGPPQETPKAVSHRRQDNRMGYKLRKSFHKSASRRKS
jgi:hypothetical protein